MIKLKNILNEYITNPILQLKAYLTQGDDAKTQEIGVEMAFVNLEILEDYLLEVEPELIEKYKDEFEEDDSDVVYKIKDEHPQLFANYSKDVMDNYNFPDFFESGYPSWYYFDYRGIVKNQWLIHFSDNAAHIHHDGKFDNLVYDYTQLGLTTQYVDRDMRDDHGYGFAYLLSDFKRHYKNRHGNKYGDEAVLFRASGIHVWHYGDEEPQVIFYGPTAHDIVYIQENYGDYSVKGVGKRDLLYTGDISDVVSWIVNNYDQYKKNI